MNSDRQSKTAYYVAMMRAAHQILDDPIVFEDPLALQIIGAEGAAKIRSQRRELQTRPSRYLRAFVVARSKFAEQELSVSIERGLCQYVILGAGLDTFAYRNPHASSDLKVFELDYPATQDWKRRLLDAAKIPIPQCLTFAPIDFETETLKDRLEQVGFRNDEPAFFSWLGVTMYLTPETVMNTIKSVASSTSAGTQIVFDYIVSPSSLSFLRRLVLDKLTNRMAAREESWQGFFDPLSLPESLRAAGFDHIEDSGPEQINKRFFKNRPDNLKAGPFAHMIKASR